MPRAAYRGPATGRRDRCLARRHVGQASGGDGARRHVQRDRPVRKRTARLQHPRAEAARSDEILAGGPFAFVFVDDAQTYEMLRAEWEAWAPLVASGGVIALHDSRPVPGDGSGEQTSVRYTREVVLKDPRFKILEVVDSVTVLERHHY